jgi:UDP-glucose 4-epimerase
LAAEWLLHDFNALYGLRFTILRYGTAYGPGMWPGLALRSFLDQAASGGPIAIFGDGTDLRRLVYVGDLARAHVLALQEIAENQVYELEGLQTVSVGELAELVSRSLGGIPIIYQRDPSRANQPSRAEKIISSEKAQRELGWRPSVDLEQGVMNTIEWYCREILHGKGSKNTLPLSVAHRFP